MDITYLFNDEAMQRFIVEGYVTLKSELPRHFHARMFEALETLDERGPHGHNNLLPCIPDLRIMLDEPVVAGALTSILGPDYYLHFHRHDHVNFPDSAQPLHKDGDNHSHYAVDGLRRNQVTRYAMLLYYPQNTPIESGPTGIVPRSQYIPRRQVEALRREHQRHIGKIRRDLRQELGDQTDEPASRLAMRQLYEKKEQELRQARPELFDAMQKADAPWESEKIPLVGDAGIISIVHFDIVHGRYSANISGHPRHMVKFLFTRNEEPREPSWDHAGTAWQIEPDAPEAPAWEYLWNWHKGTPAAPAQIASPDAAKNLRSDDDRLALGAAYTLGSQPAGLSTLKESFFTDNVGLRTMAAYGLTRSGAAAVPMLLDGLDRADASLAVRIIDVLGDMGPRAASAAETLATYANHAEPTVRRYALEALGLVISHNAEIDQTFRDTLSAGLVDEDAIARRDATFAIARLGERANNPETVQRVTDNLYHWHHHVRGWSIEALLRFQDPQATKAALNYLSSARWDESPKSGDRPPTSATLQSRSSE